MLQNLFSIDGSKNLVAWFNYLHLYLVNHSICNGDVEWLDQNM
jgi:hypothetical protein